MQNSESRELPYIRRGYVVKSRLSQQESPRSLSGVFLTSSGVGEKKMLLKSILKTSRADTQHKMAFTTPWLSAQEET